MKSRLATELCILRPTPTAKQGDQEPRKANWIVPANACRACVRAFIHTRWVWVGFAEIRGRSPRPDDAGGAVSLAELWEKPARALSSLRALVQSDVIASTEDGQLSAIAKPD